MNNYFKISEESIVKISNQFGIIGMKALAMHYFIKRRFKNSTVYNSSIEKISKLTGLNFRTVKKYLIILSELGLTRKTNNNLTFLSPVKTFKTFNNKLIKINFNDSLEDILDTLIIHSIKHFANKQQKKIQQLEDRLLLKAEFEKPEVNIAKLVKHFGKSVSLKSLAKRHLKLKNKGFLDKLKPLSENDKKVYFGFTGLGNKLNLSPSTVRKSVVKLTKKKVINSYTLREVVKDYKGEIVRMDSKIFEFTEDVLKPQFIGHLYVSNNVLKIVRGTVFELDSLNYVL